MADQGRQGELSSQRNVLGGRFITWEHKSHSITDWLHKKYLRVALKSAKASRVKALVLFLLASMDICFANSSG